MAHVVVVHRHRELDAEGEVVVAEVGAEVEVAVEVVDAVAAVAEVAEAKEDVDDGESR